MGNKRGLAVRLKRQKVGTLSEISVFNQLGTIKSSSNDVKKNKNPPKRGILNKKFQDTKHMLSSDGLY